MTHVLSVIDDLGFGGGENRLLTFARTIDRRRFRHSVLAIRAAAACPPQSSAMRAQYAAAGVNVVDLGEGDAARGRPLAARVPGAARRLARKVRRLRRVMRDQRVDVVDAHLESAGVVAALATAGTPVPCALTLYSARPPAAVPAWDAIGRFAIWNARATITDSDVRADDIRTWMRPARVRVFVIPNGVVPPRPARPPDEVRRSLAIPCGAHVRVVAQIGGLVPYKGYGVLLHAARLILAARRDVYFLLVGFERPGGGYAAHLQREAAALGVAAHTRIVSYPGPIGDIWSIVDVHAHATLFDSLPNAILEGMALAKPAVVTAVGGIPDAVEHGRTGLVVRPDCPDDLAAALLRLLDDPDRARRLAEAAHDRYRDEYRPDVMTGRLEALLESLARARADGPWIA